MGCLGVFLAVITIGFVLERGGTACCDIPLPTKHLQFYSIQAVSRW